MSTNEIQYLTNIISTVDPKIGAAIKTLTLLFNFFNTSTKRSEAVEEIERRAIRIIQVLANFKDKTVPYYKELEIRLYEDLWLLEKIKNG